MRFIRETAVMVACGACAAIFAAEAVADASPPGSEPRTSPVATVPVGLSSPRVVSLITGERVHLAAAGDRTVVGIQPGPQTAGAARVRTMTVGSHAYVVPDLALPYLGRQLDLSLFDVTLPVERVEITYTGRVPVPIPGLKELSGAGTGGAGDGAGRTVRARVDSPTDFAAALRAPNALRGVAVIRAARPAGAGDAGPRPAGTADPHYPMTTLTVRGLDRVGAKAISGTVAVDNVDDLRRYANMQSFAPTGDASFSVPVGTYSIAVEVATVSDEGRIVADSFVLFPELTVRAPSTVVVADARTATSRIPKPTTPKSATVEQTTATFGRTMADGLQTALSFMVTGLQPEMYATPTSPVTIGEVHWYTYFRLNGPDGDTPFLYDLQFPNDGVVPEVFDTTVTEAQLATVEARYHSDVPDHAIGTYRASKEPWELIPMRFASTAVAPLRRTEYVSTPGDMLWASGVVWQPAENNGVDLGPWSSLTAGERHRETHLAAPLVPGADASTNGSVPCPVCRQDETISLNLAPWTGMGGRVVSALSESETLKVASPTRLYADGVLVKEMTSPTGTADLPAGASDLRLELDTTKSAVWTTTAAEVRTVWRWRTAASSLTLPQQRTCSDGARDCWFEPLLFVGYDAGVDQSNAIPPGSATEIGIVARHQLFDPAPDADTITFDVSADDGVTWAPVDVRADGAGHFTATVAPLAGSRFLSFRVHASDPAGNTVDQVVTRAVQVTG
jgi:hypothetical protein